MPGALVRGERLLETAGIAPGLGEAAPLAAADDLGDRVDLPSSPFGHSGYAAERTGAPPLIASSLIGWGLPSSAPAVGPASALTLAERAA